MFNSFSKEYFHNSPIGILISTKAFQYFLSVNTELSSSTKRNLKKKPSDLNSKKLYVVSIISTT